MPPSPVEKLFYQGNYLKILDNTLVERAIDPSGQPFIVGALVFEGRGDEALALFAGTQHSLTEDQRWACRFFIMIHHVRLGQTQAAKTQRTEHSKLNCTNALQRFYKHQADAFFEYYLGKRKQASELLNLSLQNALEAQFSWGRILALDMLSHIHFHEGKIQQALKNFKTCVELAESIENSNLAEAIHVTIALYKARISIPSSHSMDELEALLHSTRVSDTYSHANILLELSQQATLMGQWFRAEQFLNRALTFIYQFSNAKQDVVLNFRWAYLTFCHGEYEKALNFLSIAKAKAVDAREESLTLSIWGFEQRLIQQMNFPSQIAQKFAKSLEILKSTHSSYFEDRIVSRPSASGNKKSDHRRGEDPLGDALDEIETSAQAISTIASLGLLGLLKSKSLIPKKEVSLVIDTHNQILICSDRQSIQHFDLKSKKRLFQLLILLTEGKKDRAEIFTLVWKTKYVAHLHDSVLYTSIANLRKLLGPFAYFVETSENGYRLKPELRVISVKLSEDRLINNPAQNQNPIIQRQVGLNSRQLQLMEILKPNELIDTRTYSRLFKVSTATANRDLRALARSNRITRQGRSRDIAYALIAYSI